MRLHLKFLSLTCVKATDVSALIGELTLSQFRQLRPACTLGINWMLGSFTVLLNVIHRLLKPLLLLLLPRTLLAFHRFAPPRCRLLSSLSIEISITAFSFPLFTANDFHLY